MHHRTRAHAIMHTRFARGWARAASRLRGVLNHASDLQVSPFSTWERKQRARYFSDRDAHFTTGPPPLPFPGLLWSFFTRRVSPLGPQKAPGPFLTIWALGSRSLKTPGEATLLSCPRTQGCETRTHPRTPPRAQSRRATHGPLCQPRGFSAQQHGRKPRQADRLLAMAGSLAVSGGQAGSPDPSRSPNIWLL